MLHGRLVMAICLFFAVVAGTSVYVPHANAQSKEEIQEQIDAGTQEIERLKKEIAELEKNLQDTSKQRQTLQKAVDELNYNIQKLTKSISLTQAEVSKKDVEIVKLAGTIETTAEQIARSQAQVANSLRELDSISSEPLVLRILGGGTLSTFFDEATTLEALRLDLQEHIYTLSGLKTDLEENKGEAENKKQELTQLTSRLGQERQGLDVVKQEQTKLLNDTKSQEAAYQAQLAQKRAEQAAFEAALFALVSQGGEGFSSGDVPAPAPGILQWPLANVFITQQFGKTGDSGRLYASGTHDGVDFRASVGTAVLAARTGIVQEINNGAVPYCQYGKWVLVRHDNGLTTLYAHLSRIDVQKGAVVSTGQVLGYSGNTGYSIGPHLHFTTYVSQQVSLKQYTCKSSGATVTIPIAQPAAAYLNPLSYLPAL